MNWLKNLDAARRLACSLRVATHAPLVNLDAARRLACSLRAATRAPLAWFTEGFDTADLKDAKALLDELSA